MLKEKLKITRDIHTINGKLLIPRGEVIDFDMMEEICRKNAYSSRVNVKLKETYVFRDLFLLTQVHPYKEFCSKLDEKNILKIFGDINIPVVIVEEYHFMRMKDEYTYNHCLNTALLTLCMALQFYDDKQKIVQVTASSLTHDIGKSRIPSNILHSGFPLTEAEFGIIKEHPIYGAVLCSYYYGSPYTPNTVAALQHHEKKNATGYPMGIRLKDENVFFIVVADIFDALISKRPYRNESYDVRGAIDILCKSAENGELDESKIRMLIYLNRKAPPALPAIKYSKNYRGFYPDINYYDTRRTFFSA